MCVYMSLSPLLSLPALPLFDFGRLITLPTQLSDITMEKDEGSFPLRRPRLLFLKF